MDDQEILIRIQALIDEEHELRQTNAEEHRAASTSWRSRSTSAGTCSASAGPAATPTSTPTSVAVRDEASSRATSSSVESGPSPSLDEL